jgi:hypothetical protein
MTGHLPVGLTAVERAVELGVRIGLESLDKRKISHSYLELNHVSTMFQPVASVAVSR